MFILKSRGRGKIFYTLFFWVALHIWYKVLYFWGMKLMTVKEYAQYVGKSIPLIYKQIRQGKLKIEDKYGITLIKTNLK